MKVLFSSSELAPLCQSGGLGDAVSGLARDLGALGHEVIVVVPGYRSALRSPHCPRLVDGGTVQVRCRNAGAERFDVVGRLLSGPLFPGVEVVFIDVPSLFDRAGLYGEHGHDYGDNDLRFIAFARAAAYVAEARDVDVVVAHDWHAALGIAALVTSMARGRNRRIATVQVVHNAAHQGRVPASSFGLTGLADDLFHPDGVESWGALNLLKAGVAFADRVVTVSPTYATEITTAEFGEGLEGLFRSRGRRLLGVVNGIDTVRFDPQTDRELPARFSAREPAGKAACRAALLHEVGLRPPAPGRFVAAVGRLAGQKGWDIIIDALDGLLAQGCSVALLGDGDAALAHALHEKSRQHPDRIWFHAGFNEPLSRRVYAGADAILVPSRFEPCGLVQLIAQRYGTVPVAHATGGLVDTIIDLDSSTTGTGVLFSPLGASGLVEAVARVGAVADGGGLAALQQRVMGLDVSWDVPARAWSAIFETVVAEARARG